MARYLTVTEARNFDVDGKTYDLISLIEALDRTPDGWVQPKSVNDLTVGQIVHVWALGDRLRRGVVAKLGRSKATVVFTTQGAVDSSRRAEEYHTAKQTEMAGKPIVIRVADTPVALNRIHVPAPEAAKSDLVVDEPTTTGKAEEEDGWLVDPENVGRVLGGVAGPPAPSDVPTLTEKTEEEDGNLVDQSKRVPAFPKDNRAPVENERVMTKMDAPAGAGSSVVAVLEKVWDKIREDTPDLPDVVIVTGSGLIGPPRWGHFRANGWTGRAEKSAATDLTLGEMFVAGETLARGARHTLETMLHEAAHVLAKVRGIQDTSRQGRWHNRRFCTLAESLGLEYEKTSAHPQIGFSEVVLTPGTEEQYAEVIDELDKAIRLTVELPTSLRPVPGDTGDATPLGAGESMGHHGARKPRAEGASSNSNNVKATCLCEEPRIIRVSRKVLDGPGILCGECGEAFADRS